MTKKPRFLRWDWIAVFSGAFLILAGMLSTITSGTLDVLIFAGFSVFSIGAALLIADY